uniref:(northern house mosquito) hypothetical protein n=1 Tax=Culex pipiens TaxID=7175 RepID=A0A8D8GSP9_CULPI
MNFLSFSVFGLKSGTSTTGFTIEATGVFALTSRGRSLLCFCSPSESSSLSTPLSSGFFGISIVLARFIRSFLLVYLFSGLLTSPLTCASCASGVRLLAFASRRFV